MNVSDFCPGLGVDKSPRFILNYADILCKCVAKVAALCNAQNSSGERREGCLDTF